MSGRHILLMKVSFGSNQMPLSFFVIFSSWSIVISFPSIMDLSRGGPFETQFLMLSMHGSSRADALRSIWWFETSVSLFQTLKMLWFHFCNIHCSKNNCCCENALVPRIASGPLGQHSASSNKSWHRNLICLDIVFDYSTQRSPQRWTTLQEHGHPHKSTKEWSSRRSAKCFASSNKRNTKRLKSKDEK